MVVVSTLELILDASSVSRRKHGRDFVQIDGHSVALARMTLFV